MAGDANCVVDLLPGRSVRGGRGGHVGGGSNSLGHRRNGGRICGVRSRVVRGWLDDFDGIAFSITGLNRTFQENDTPKTEGNRDDDAAAFPE